MDKMGKTYKRGVNLVIFNEQVLTLQSNRDNLGAH
jgi:hypothetical protein